MNRGKKPKTSSTLKLVTNRRGTSKTPVVLKSPESLCLYSEENTANTIQFLNKIRAFEADQHDRLIVDLSNLSKLTAAAATLLFAYITNLQISYRINAVDVRLPEDKDTRQRIVSSGLYKALKPGGGKKLDNMWSDKEPRFLCGNNKKKNDFLSIISKTLIENESPRILTTAIAETLLNVHHHAYQDKDKSITWWSYSHFDSDKHGKFIVCVVVDMGVGIANRIKSAFPLLRVHDDSLCIERAMERSVSSTMINGRGQGSVNIKRPVSNFNLSGNDKLLIVSGTGTMAYIFQDEIFKSITADRMQNAAIRGTMIEWKLYYEPINEN